MCPLFPYGADPHVSSAKLENRLLVIEKEFLEVSKWKI
jgi:hypothetical protein